MCVFCSIVKGDIPSNKLYEDDMVIAFFDINPTSYGHCLVVPKEHCDSFLDCPTKTCECSRRKTRLRWYQRIDKHS